MKKENKTREIIIAIICIILFGSVCVGTAYAFIAATIIGNEDNGDITIKSAQVYAMFEGNDLDAKQILPGYSNSIEFTITNTSTTPNTYGNYSLVWNIDKNEINDNNFVYTLVGKTYNGSEEVTTTIPYNTVINISETRVPEMSTVLGTGVINTGITHKYKLTITFKETGTAQNELQNKEFLSTIAAKGEPQV